MLTKKILMALTLTAVSVGPIYGHRHYNRHPMRHHCHTTVVRPVTVVASSMTNGLTRKGRLDLAVAYLRNNHHISASQYARITGLDKSFAEAELNMFAKNRCNPICAVPGKKSLYYLKGQP